MLPPFVGEVLIILCLVLANGFFSGAEIAIIAARRSRLQQLADAGDSGARLAIDLANDPNRFLPTVQVGITLVGTFAAAFGGARVGDWLADLLGRLELGFLEGYERGLSLTAVVVGLTYCSVLLGELVPKRLALRHADALARFVAPPMNMLARLGRPVVWLMGRSTDAVLFMLRVEESTEPKVSVEDIEHMIESGTQSGAIEPAEQQLAMEALRLGERTAHDIMRPRVDIDALDVETPSGEILGAVAMANFSRLPLYEGNLDHIIGFVHVKDVLRRHYLGLPILLRNILHPVQFVPETLPIDRLLVSFQEQGSHLAIVLDEFGGTEGMVTLHDVLEELVGEIREDHRRDQAQRFIQRDELSWLVDGTVGIDELIERILLKDPHEESPRNFSTIAGLILAELGRIPKIGEFVDWHGVHIEVVDMDGPRIDRVLLTKRKNQSPAK